MKGVVRGFFSNRGLFFPVTVSFGVCVCGGGGGGSV